MKNVLIGIFAGISALSLGYIGYSELSDKGTTCPEFDKAAECSKEVCDHLYGNDENIDDEVDEDTYEVHTSGFYHNGKEYMLDIYTLTGFDVKIDDFRFNNKPFKLEQKDSFIYLNDKKIGEAQALYVTNSHIFLLGAGQNGSIFISAVDQNGNVTNLEDNKIIGDYHAEHIYLDMNGNLVAIGGAFCGLDCSSDKEVVTFKNNNGKLEITKTKLK